MFEDNCRRFGNWRSKASGKVLGGNKDLITQPAQVNKRTRDPEGRRGVRTAGILMYFGGAPAR